MNAPVAREAAYSSERHDHQLAFAAAFVLRHRRWLVLTPMLFVIVVGAVTMLTPRQYAASASFMTQQREAAAAGGALAIARQFGINLAGSNTGESPQVYAELLRGRRLLKRAVESEYVVAGGDGEPVRITLIEHFGISSSPTRAAWLEAVDELRGRLAVSVARETGIVHVSATAESRSLAEQIAATVLRLLNDFNLEIRQTQALAETKFVAERLTEADAALKAAEGDLQSFLQRNRSFTNSPELVFEHDRLQRQVGMRQQLYTALAEAHEQTRLDAVRDIPVVTIIDAPTGSGEPKARGTVVRAFLAGVLGIVVAVMVGLLSDHFRRGRLQRDDDYRELRELKDEAVADLRAPLRWFQRT